MTAARPADGLLPAAHVIALIQLVGRRAHGCQPEEVIGDLCAASAAGRSKSWNTLLFLRDLGVFRESDGVVVLSSDWQLAPQDLYRAMGHLAAKQLAEAIIREGSSCLQSGDTGLWIDSMLMPRTAEGLPLWVIEFQVASRERIHARLWQISIEFEKIFWVAAREANQTLHRRAMTIAQLHKRLAEDAAAGLAAEIWALDFERRRLFGHPFIEDIKRVSDENVSAGYDIASFASKHSLFHDLFIEVKAYKGDKRFYWSSGEVDAAKAAGEEYSLYLVDSMRLGEEGYEPEIIAGPYSALFETSDSSWATVPDSFLCTHRIPDD